MKTESNRKLGIGASRGSLAVWAAVGAAVAALAVPAMGRAGQITWNGLTSSDFEDGGNWVNGVAPANSTATDSALFSGAPTANQPTLSIARSINGVLFSTPAGGWNLGGNFLLTVGSGGISTVGQASGTNTVSANIGIGANPMTIQAGTGGTLIIGGSISTVSGGVLNFGAAGTGAGTVVIANTNTYTNDIGIVGGTVLVMPGANIGNGTSNKLTGSGGTLNLNGSFANVSTILGGGYTVTNTGSTLSTLTFGIALTNPAGSNATTALFSGNLAMVKSGVEVEQLNQANTFTGGLTINGGTIRTNNVTGWGAAGSTVTLNGGTVWNTAAGTYTQNFLINSGVNYFRPEGTPVYSGNITGSAVVNVVSGGSNLTLGGNLSGFAGTIQLVMESNQAIGTVGNGAILAGVSRTLSLTNATPGSASAAWVVGTGVPASAGLNSTLQWNGIGSVTMPLGSLSGGANGTGILRNNVASSTVTFQVGALGADSGYGGTIVNGTGTAALNKVGAGTLALAGSNTYTGGTKVLAGTIAVGANNTGTTAGPVGPSTASVMLGDISGTNSATFAVAGAFTNSNPVTVMSGSSGTLSLAGTTDNNGAFGGAVTLNHALTLSQVTSGSNNGLTVSGAITSGGGAQVVTFAGPGTISASNIGNGAGTMGVSVTGGTAILTGNAHSYSGNTTINGGTLLVTGSPSIGGISFGGGNLSMLSSSASSITASGGLSVATSAGISLDIGTPGVNDRISVGQLSVGAGQALTINVTNIGGVGVGNYNLLSYSSESLGAGASIALGTAPALPGKTVMLVDTGSGLQLQIAGTAAPGAAWFTNRVDASWATLSGGTVTNWSTTQNGLTDPHVVVGSNTDVHFAAANATNLNTTLDADFGIKGLFFDAGTPSVTIGGGNALTILGDGIAVNNNGAPNTIGVATINLGASQTWNNASDSPLAVSSVIADGSGASVLTINNTGSGAIVLSGNSTYGGGTVLSAGNVQTASNHALGTGLVTVNGGTLDLANSTLTIGGLAGTGGTIGNASGFGTANLVIVETGTHTYSGLLTDIGGQLAVEKQGSGTTILLGNETFSGFTTITAGKLQLGDGATATGSVANSIIDNGTLEIANPTDQTLANSISGSGVLVKSGAGKLTIPSGNSHSGGTTVNGGTLNANGSGSLGSGPLTVNAGIVNANSANVTAGGATVNSGSLNLNTGNAIVAASSVSGGSLALNASSSLDANLTVNSGSVTFGAANAMDTTRVLNVLGGTVDLAGNSQTLGNAITPVQGIVGATAGGTVTSTLPGAQLTTFLTGTSIMTAFNGQLGLSLFRINGNNANTQLNGTSTYSGGTTIRGMDALQNVGQVNSDNILSTGGFTGVTTLNVIRSNTVYALGTGPVTLDDAGIFFPSQVTTGTTFANDINVTPNGGYLRTEQSFNGTLTYTGSISGTGTLVLQNGFLAPSAFSGDMSAFSGILAVDTVNVGGLRLSGAALGSPSMSVVLVGGQNRTIDWVGTADATVKIGNLSGGPSTLRNNGTAGTTATFELGALNQDIAFPGTVVNGAGTTAISKVGTGTLTFSGNTTYSGNTTVTNGKVIFQNALRPVTGSLVVTGAGAVSLAAPASAGNYTVAGEFATISASGAIAVAAVDRAVNRQSVAIAGLLALPGGTLDLADNDAVLHATGESAADALVKSGALRSSTAGTGGGADMLAGLGVISNSDGAGGALFSTFDGVTVSATDVLVKYTYLGDTDLNGVVDGADVANLFAGMHGALTGWANGDLDYSGAVDSADLALLMASLRGQTTSFGNGSGGMSGAVPEPSALALGILALPALGRRRR